MDFPPTPSCPHRWCHPAHLLLLFACVTVFVTGTMLSTWQGLVLEIVLGAVSWYVMGRILPTPPPPGPETWPVTELKVRRGWARAALLVDLLFVGCAALLIFANLTSSGEPRPEPPLLESLSIGLVVLAAGAVLWAVPHRAASRRRRPDVPSLCGVYRTKPPQR